MYSEKGLTRLTELTPHDDRLTQSEIASHKGVSRQAISKRAKRLIADGLIDVDSAGRISLAQWDKAVGQTTDPSRFLALEMAHSDAREAKESTDSSQESLDPSYNRAKARAAHYDAERKEIELRQLKGRLVDIDDLTNAMQDCAGKLVRVIDRLPSRADDLAAAYAREGVQGLRHVLKLVAEEWRELLADEMKPGND